MSATLVAEQPRTAERAASRRASLSALLANPWFIAAVALTGRLLYMVILRTWDFRSDHNHFPFGYETGSIARSIAAGKGFASPFRNVDTGPTAWIAPIYPYFCALAFKLFGTFSAASAVAILGGNSLVSALTIVPLFRIANRFFGRATAITATWTWAIVPYFMMWPAAWVWEAGWSAFLVAFLISRAIDLRDTPRRHWLHFGAIAGITILINPALLTILPIAALWAVYRSQLRFIAMKHAVLAGLVCIAVISPWLVRNRVVLGKWVFLRDNFAFEFSLGNYPGGSGMGWNGFHPAVNDRVMKEYSQKGEIAFLEARARFPRTFATQQSSEFLRMTRHRFTAFWDGTSQYWSHFDQDIWTPLPFFSVTILALLGLSLALGNRVAVAPLLGITCVLYPWPYYITYAQTRYRHAIEPLLVMLAAYFVVQLVERLRFRFSPLLASKRSPAV